MKKIETALINVPFKTVQSILVLLVLVNLLLVAGVAYSKSFIHFSAFRYKHAQKSASAYSVTPPPLLRLKMFAGNAETDDIAIGFLATASVNYNPNEDSQYFPGLGAPVGLYCFSADNVKLSVDLLPLPLTQIPLIIKLDVEAEKSGAYSMLRTQLDTIPAAYNLWLVDKYKKDSIDLRNSASYAFSIDKTDSASFGSNRFQVYITNGAASGPVICGDTTLKAKILTFDGIKATGGTQLSWVTFNERNTSHFAVQRSTDDGKTFDVIDSLASNSAGAYSFLDRSPQPGTNVYRLKLTDLKDSVSFSSLVPIVYPATTVAITSPARNSIKIYPNPAVSTINLSIVAIAPANGTVYDIMIMNSSGMVVKNASSSQTSWQENVSNLLPGTYFVNVVKDADKSPVGKSKFIKL